MLNILNMWQKGKKGRKSESGNVFATLFAAVAIVGIVGAGTVSLLKGPVAGMVSLNKHNIAEMRMEIAAKLIMADALNQFSTYKTADGDTDTTDYIELAEYSAGSITGGGTIPTTLNINDIDPWGSQFGYCTWDNGDDVNNAKSDGGAETDNRLQGQNTQNTEFIILVSAGPDRVFQTGCYAHDSSGNEGLVKVPGSDDIVISYTYSEAVATMGDLWQFGTDTGGTESVMEIDKNLDLRDDVSITGLLTFNIANSGLILPDSPGTTCTVAQDMQLFLDTSTTPPSLVICNSGIIESIVEGGSETDITTGLVGHWKLDETGNTSTAADEIGTNDGTLTDYDADPTASWLDGQIDGALDFNGSDEYVSVPDDGTKFDLQTNFTVSVWVNLNATSTKHLLRKGHASSPYYSWAMQFNGTQFHAYLREDSGDANLFGGSSIAVSTWYHVAFVKDGLNLYLYLDGTEVDTNTYDAGSTPLDGDGALIFGHDTSSQYYNGQLDDIRIYNSALSADDISTLYSNGITGVGSSGTSVATSLSNTDISADTYYWSDNTSNTPVLATGTAGDFVSVEGAQGANADHACGITGDGSVWCWGGNTEKQLGQSDTAATYTVDDPVEVDGVSNVVDITAGDDYTCALDNGGTTQCWGDAGNLGDSSVVADSDTPVTVTGGHVFTKIDSETHRGDSTCGLGSGGSIWCWGDDSNGRLGNDETIGNDSVDPVQVAGISDFVDLSVGRYHACGLRKNGDIWCWGGNSEGQLGNGTSGTDSGIPVQVESDVKFKKVSAARDSVCAISVDNEIYCWGRDVSGILGIASSSEDQLTPGLVTDSDQDFVAMHSCSRGHCAVKSTGKLYCWGSDTYRGDGSGGSADSPTEVLTLTNVVGLGCTTDDFWAVQINTVNGDGDAPTSAYEIRQLQNSGETLDSHGLSVTLDSSSANDEAGLGFAVDATSTGGSDILSTAIVAQNKNAAGTALNFEIQNIAGTDTTDTFIIDAEGAVGAHADNSTNDAILATGGTGTRDWNSDYYYGFLAGDDAYSTVSAGFFGIDEASGTTSVLFSKELYISGTNNDGTSLQDIAYFISGSPIELYAAVAQSNSDSATTTISAHSTNGTDVAVLRFDRYGGTFASPGTVPSNVELGQIRFLADDGTTTDADGLASIGAESVGSAGSGTLPAKLKISVDPAGNPTGEDFTVDESGNVGVGVASADSLLHVGGRGAVDDGVKISNDTNCASSDEGALRYTSGNKVEYCDGSSWNDFSTSGSGGGGGSTCDHGQNFINLTTSEDGTCGTFQNGRVACWGDNSVGEMGRGVSTLNLSDVTPTRETLLSNVKSVHFGANMGCAILQDKSVKCWGNNADGKLGIGVDGSSYNYPVDVNMPEDIMHIDLGQQHSCAISESGRVLCWGSGGNGQLGWGVYTDSNVPVYANNISHAVKIASAATNSCVITKDGTAKCWGNNIAGQLGTGATGAAQNTPQDVINLTDLVDIAPGGTSGATSFACALERDGDVWCWGDNALQQLGNGSGADVLTPAQVTGVSGVIDIETGSDHVYALKDDGTVYGWGTDDYGELGLGSPGTSSAALISGLTDVVALADSGPYSDHMCFIKSDGSSQCIGQGTDGQLGDEGSSNSTSPVDILNPLACDAEKFAFVSLTYTTGDMGGLEGADAICQKDADRFNLPGTYYAWLSDDDTAPVDRFLQYTNTIKMADGTTIMSNWTTLVSDVGLATALDIYPNGSLDSGGSTNVFTNTDGDGTAKGSNNCSNWTSTSGNGHIGLDSASNTTWTDNNSTIACSASRQIYCFQQ